MNAISGILNWIVFSFKQSYFFAFLIFKINIPSVRLCLIFLAIFLYFCRVFCLCLSRSMFGVSLYLRFPFRLLTPFLFLVSFLPLLRLPWVVAERNDTGGLVPKLLFSLRYTFVRRPFNGPTFISTRLRCTASMCTCRRDSIWKLFGSVSSRNE